MNIHHCLTWVTNLFIHLISFHSLMDRNFTSQVYPLATADFQIMVHLCKNIVSKYWISMSFGLKVANYSLFLIQCIDRWGHQNAGNPRHTSKSGQSVTVSRCRRASRLTDPSLLPFNVLRFSSLIVGVLVCRKFEFVYDDILYPIISITYKKTTWKLWNQYFAVTSDLAEIGFFCQFCYT